MNRLHTQSEPIRDIYTPVLLTERAVIKHVVVCELDYLLSADLPESFLASAEAEGVEAVLDIHGLLEPEPVTVEDLEGERVGYYRFRCNFESLDLSENVAFYRHLVYNPTKYAVVAITADDRALFSLNTDNLIPTSSWSIFPAVNNENTRLQYATGSVTWKAFDLQQIAEVKYKEYIPNIIATIYYAD
jgi:hypothetical protein